MTPLAGDGDLGARASIADIEPPVGCASLENFLEIEAKTSLADSCRIGIEISFESSWSGTETLTVWCIIGTEDPSPFVTGTAKTGLG